MKKTALLTIGLGALAHSATAEPQPDFSIRDSNIASGRGGDLVSPRDYRQQVTVWYFSREW